MKKIIKLTEDDLNRIIKRVILENTDPFGVQECIQSNPNHKKLPEACIQMIPTEIPTDPTKMPTPDPAAAMNCIMGMMSLAAEDRQSLTCTLVGCSGAMCQTMVGAFKMLPGFSFSGIDAAKLENCCKSSGEIRVDEPFEEWLGRTSTDSPPGGGGYKPGDYEIVSGSSDSGTITVKIDGTNYPASSREGKWQWD